MTFLTAQAGSCRRSCGVTPRTYRDAQLQRARRLGRRHTFGRVLKAADITSVRPGSAQCGIAQPCLTLSGQRSNTDERYGLGILGRRRIDLGRSPYGDRKIGNPCAEKVGAHRSRQNKGAASLTKAHGAFRKIGEAVNRQGTLTITGSNVRLGTEMPVALSLSFA